MCQDQESPKVQKPSERKARGTASGSQASSQASSQDGKDSKQKPNDGKPKRNSKKTLKHPSRAQRVASPRIARERVLIRPVARDAVPRDVPRCQVAIAQSHAQESQAVSFRDVLTE